MERFLKNEESKYLVVLAGLLLLALLYFVWEFKVNQEKIATLYLESENLKADLAQINEKYTNTLNLLETTNKDKEAVVESLNQIGLDYNNLMQKYASSVSDVILLKRTVEIDDELLKKYSKYYFLNENYKPENLSYLNKEMTENGKNISLLPITKFRLENMLLNAKNEGVNILVNSGYRSFEEQKNLKSRYAQVYGVGKANQFSADQGYSEHQLGTTVDLTDGKSGLEQNFDTTKSFKWLQENAYKYGFILSYPKDNKYYIYEPWHWRFVGLELAKYLHENDKNFYDLDQKFIDTYKSKMFE